MSEMKVKKIKKTTENITDNTTENKIISAEIQKSAEIITDNLPKVKKVKKVNHNTDNYLLAKNEKSAETYYNGADGIFDRDEENNDSCLSKVESKNEIDYTQIHYGEFYNVPNKIMFTKVTDIDPNVYSDFTEDKYKYGMIFYDYEVFSYDFVVTFTDVIHNMEVSIVNDRKALIQFYMKHKNEIHCGYNSRHYDQFIHRAIILGMNPKEVNDKIIMGNINGYNISDKFKEVDFLDFDITKALQSLKQIEGFLGHDIRETEVSFDIDRPLNRQEIEQTLFYNKHDVHETIEVFRRRKGVYEGNIGMIEMFKFPTEYISKTQAQITSEITNCEKPKELRDDDWDLWLVDTLKLNKYKFVADWFMSLRNDHDRKRVETYSNGKFVEYKGKDVKSTEKMTLHVDVCGVPHIFAMGGVHGCPREPLFIEKKGQIMHSDVNSLYPSIMIQYGLLTRNAKNPEKFTDIYNKRIQYKKEGNPLNKILKIPLNAQYGIMGDKNSSAYDMRNCKMVCVTGQLLVLMLLEQLEPYIDLIQSNTDGIIYTVRNHERDYNTVMDIIKNWEKTTRLGFATDTIDWIRQSQVNGYVFKFSNGEYERKGAYLKKNDDLDNDLPIVNEAMFEYFANSTSVEDYINNCDDLIKFQKIVRISSSYKFAWHNGERLDNKTYRVFASKNLKNTFIGKCKYNIGEKIKSINSKGEETFRIYNAEKFANTPNNCFIVNENILGKKCSDYADFDKQWYIDVAYDRIEDQFKVDCRPDIFEF